MGKVKQTINALVIEDNLGDFVLIEEYLADFFSNPSVENAKTFREAAAALTARTDRHIVLLDLSLPDKSGEELIRQVSTYSGQIPVIVLTGYDDLSFSIKSLAMGISDYLLKDELSPLVLYKSIMYALERQRVTAALRDSEKRYRDLFQLSPQPMWVLDLEIHSFLDVNQSAIDHYGHSKEEFLAMTLADIHKEEDLADMKRAIAEVDENSTVHLIGESKHIKKNGEVIYVDLVGQVFHFNGRLTELVLATDITERKKAGERLLSATVTAEDNERKRIAQDIHDGLQQTLITAMLNIEPVLEETDRLSQGVRERFRRGYTYLNQGINETRNIAHQLMPKAIEDFGYSGAIRNMLDHLHSATQFHYHDNLGINRLPGTIEVGLYRITQEAVNNILKYSHADEAFIQVTRAADSVQLTIEDNGKGFNTGDREGNASHQGLSFMQSRVGSMGGTLEITSEIGKGTWIFVEIPLNQD